MRRGFLNNKKVKATPLYPEHVEKVRVIPKGLQGEGWSSSFNVSIFTHVTAQNIIEKVLMDENLSKYHTAVREKKVSGSGRLWHTPTYVPI